MQIVMLHVDASRQCSPSQVITQNIDDFNIQNGPCSQKCIELMFLSSLVCLFKKKKKKGIAMAGQCPLGKQIYRGEDSSALFLFSPFGRLRRSVEAPHMGNHSMISYQVFPLQGL